LRAPLQQQQQQQGWSGTGRSEGPRLVERTVILPLVSQRQLVLLLAPQVPIRLPPISGEEPVQSLRAALTELVDTRPRPTTAWVGPASSTPKAMAVHDVAAPSSRHYGPGLPVVAVPVKSYSRQILLL
jgi:hypothetical protein